MISTTKKSSVSAVLYKEMTAISREKGIPVTMHCAEVKAVRDFLGLWRMRLCLIATRPVKPEHG